MIAIDTNVLVRLLTNDEPFQAKKAAELIQTHPVFIPKTVLLETEWVLRYAYKLKRNTIITAFEKVLGLKEITIEDSHSIQMAMTWYKEGLDFADALHLASSQASSFSKICYFRSRFY